MTTTAHRADDFKIGMRDVATSYSTREAAQIVANVLAGLETRGRTFKVYEITGRDEFQIMVRGRAAGELLGWVRVA